MKKITNVPTFEEVIDQTGSVLAVIHQALEYGIENTRAFFQSRNHEDEIGQLKVDSSLAPHLVRYFAKDFLVEYGYSVIEEEAAYEINEVPQNGLWVILGRFHFRIWKSSDGRVPVPGHSRIKQEYYQQSFHQYTFRFPDLDTGDPSTTKPIACIVLWSTDSSYSRLNGIRLACPKKGDVSRASIDVHWNVPVEHPVLSLAPKPADESEVADGFTEDDLPITRKAKDEQDQQRKTGTEGTE